jgi:mannose/fructose/N-acetylgalactosamine-specific phosphotransferase system component IIC
VLFAYLKMPMVGIALTAAALGVLYISIKGVANRG